MSYLESLPRRLVTLYLPLSMILIVLLFPFYWMALTAIKPDEQLLDIDKYNPFWTWTSDLQAHPQAAVRDATIRTGCGTRCMSRSCATVLSIFASVLAAYAIVRLRYQGRRRSSAALIFLAYLVPPSILFIPLATVVFQYGLFDSPLALILTYPTILIPFSTWLLMGYFKTIPFELEECALIDGASRWQILIKIVLPLAIPGLISAFIFCFTLCWNEFIYALTFLQSTQNKTVPVAIVNEFVDGDIYRLGLADGGRAGRLAAAGDPLRLLRRALRVGDDRRREGVGARPGSEPFDPFSCREPVPTSRESAMNKTTRSWLLHILVLGAAGMVGRKLVERLLRDGRLGKTRHHPADAAGRGGARRSRPRPGFPVEVVTCDFAVAGAAEKLVAGRPDVIFHLAAIVSGEAELDFDKGYRINLDGTRMLLDADPAGRRRLQAAPGLHLLDRGVRRAVPGRDRRRVLPHAAVELRHPEGDRRAAAGRLFAPRLPRRHRHPPADHLHPARPAQQGGLRLLLQHPARAAGRQGGDAAGVRGRPPLACHAALGGRLPAPCRDHGPRRGRPAPQPDHARPVRDRRRADRGAEAGGGRQGRRAHQARAGSVHHGHRRRLAAQFRRRSGRCELGFTTAEKTFDDIIRIHIEDELGGKFVA